MSDKITRLITRIESRYNAENDVAEPYVSITEMRLLECIEYLHAYNEALARDIGKLKKRVKALENPEVNPYLLTNEEIDK